MSAARPHAASRRPPSLGACLVLAVCAALAGLGLRLATPPTAPAGGAEAAYRQFEQMRGGLPPDKVRQIERVWRRLDRAPASPAP